MTDQEPEFLQPLDNLTVTQGRDVSFTCVVNNLGQYRVSSCALCKYFKAKNALQLITATYIKFLIIIHSYTNGFKVNYNVQNGIAPEWIIYISD